MANSPICSIPNCGKNAIARGWCTRHYGRFKVHGDPLKTLKAENGEPLAFLQNVALKHTGHECLKWPYAVSSAGYGKMIYDGTLSYVHAIVCEIIHGTAPSPSHQARHLCGKGHEACCSPHHVAWGTVRENMADKLMHGTDNRGIRHSMKKITEADVLKIRELCAQGIPQKTIAKQFGIQQMQVSRIHRRERWAHI